MRYEELGAYGIHLWMMSEGIVCEGDVCDRARAFSAWWDLGYGVVMKVV